jgi:hypothetical protein
LVPLLLPNSTHCWISITSHFILQLMNTLTSHCSTNTQSPFPLTKSQLSLRLTDPPIFHSDIHTHLVVQIREWNFNPVVRIYILIFMFCCFESDAAIPLREGNMMSIKRNWKYIGQVEFLWLSESFQGLQQALYRPEQRKSTIRDVSSASIRKKGISDHSEITGNCNTLSWS